MDENIKKVNPYGVLGKLHNEGMDYLIENISNQDKDISEVSIQEIIEIVSEYLSTIYLKNTNYIQGSKIDQAINYEVIAKVLNKYKNLTLTEIIKFSDVSLSDESKSYLNQLDNLNLEEPESALIIMKEIEYKILISNMPDLEQRYPLIFIAMAEASIEYMKSIEGIRKGQAKTTLWSKFIFKLKNFPWKTDGRGAVSGAIQGGIGGVIDIPKLAIAAVLGAVGSAIVLSCEAIIFPLKENTIDIEVEEKKIQESIKKLHEKSKRLRELNRKYNLKS